MCADSHKDFERTYALGKIAFSHIKKNRTPAVPNSYEFWYVYASGSHENLNRRVNEILAQGDLLTPDLVSSLYAEFVSAPRLEHKVGEVSDRIAESIEEIASTLKRAIEDTGDYKGNLKGVSKKLNSQLSQHDFIKIVGDLKSATAKTIKFNNALETQLTSYRKSIVGLRQELDDVRRESMLDPLTRIANRKNFNERIAHEVEIANAQNSPFCVIMIDIDHFKQFNDVYGHQIGDQVLRLVGITLESNLKGQDLAARYGGEEFAAILPNTELEGACAAAEIIREAIMKRELVKRSTNERLGRITVSMGVAEYRSLEPYQAAIERADQCLYTAKRNGRNQVISTEHVLYKKEHGESAA